MVTRVLMFLGEFEWIVNCIVFTGLLELLLSSTKHIDFLVLFWRVQFGTFGLLLENDLLADILDCLYIYAFEILML